MTSLDTDFSEFNPLLKHSLTHSLIIIIIQICKNTKKNRYLLLLGKQLNLFGIWELEARDWALNMTVLLLSRKLVLAMGRSPMTQTLILWAIEQIAYCAC